MSGTIPLQSHYEYIQKHASYPYGGAPPHTLTDHCYYSTKQKSTFGELHVKNMSPTHKYSI